MSQHCGMANRKEVKVRDREQIVGRRLIKTEQKGQFLKTQVGPRVALQQQERKVELLVEQQQEAQDEAQRRGEEASMHWGPRGSEYEYVKAAIILILVVFYPVRLREFASTQLEEFADMERGSYWQRSG